MRARNKLVHGVGVNDAEYHVQEYDSNNKRIWVCPYYDRWVGVLRRSNSKKFFNKSPSYKGCTISESWKTFSNFASWMDSQDWVGKVLDKDLVKWDNRMYCEEYCVFITNELNTFIIDRKRDRGDLPIGVTRKNTRGVFKGKYSARCMNPFNRTRDYLGDFNDPWEAHEAWRARKHSLALLYADMQTDPRVAEALRTRYLPDSPYLQSILPKSTKEIEL